MPSYAPCDSETSSFIVADQYSGRDTVVPVDQVRCLVLALDTLHCCSSPWAVFWQLGTDISVVGRRQGAIVGHRRRATGMGARHVLTS